MPFDWSALLIVLQLIYLEGILSIDNAAVLGAMVSVLPRSEPIPWPRRLRFLQRPVHRLLGGQQMAALKAGLFGAYLGRGSMLLAALWVARNRWLLLLGGLYLIYLAFSHFGAKAEEAERRANGGRVAAAAFWLVVLNVELADLAFSIDNVVAAAALSREKWVLFTGVFLGIVTMRFAAGIFVRLLERWPILEAAAYLLVFVIGLELFAEELLGIHFSHASKFAISLSVIVVTLAYGRSRMLQALGRRLRWVRRGLAAMSAAVRTLMRPLGWAARGSVRVGRKAIDARRARRGRRHKQSVADRRHPSHAPGGDGGV